MAKVGLETLKRAAETKIPVVAVLGQAAGWGENRDPLLNRALERAGRSGTHWVDLIKPDPLDEHFYDWLSERFARRAPSGALQTIGEGEFSAVFTSSIDPGITNLFAVHGRQPEPILLGDPLPRVIRSKPRPPIFYLFGQAAAGIPEVAPPRNTIALAQRKLRQAAPMLRLITESATPVGLIVVDGYRPSEDWLRAEDLLTALMEAPPGGVLWCGPTPSFDGDSLLLFEELVRSGVVLQDVAPLHQLLAELAVALPSLQHDRWDEPEVISLDGAKRLITTPRLRLATQASATIIDDSWTGFIDPVSVELERAAFVNFHAGSISTRSLIEGVRRGFAIERTFEGLLLSRVLRALGQHHAERGALILHGQSGVGKTIALARLATRIREDRVAAVLWARGRVPQATDIGEFLEEVDKVEGITLLIVDATAAPARYHELLTALRSRGHRVVVVGSTYRIDLAQQSEATRLIEAPALLDVTEQKALSALTSRFTPESVASVADTAAGPNALARFYWELPASRYKLSEGLGNEARHVQANLQARGGKKERPRNVGAMAEALIKAGYSGSGENLWSPAESPEEDPEGTAAARVVDYVMASSRLFKPVPANLVVRAATDHRHGHHALSLELISELFSGQDLFRWYWADEREESLLIGARLQIEAELVCKRRLGTPEAEAARLIDLIRAAYRAGPEDSEETAYLVDVVHALGPDGPFGDRYRDSYAEVARALTELRVKHGVLNARLMLQESTLRRTYVRTHDPNLDERARLLDEASQAVEHALEGIDQQGPRRIHAGKRTRDNLWVERAATYGFLATDSVQRGDSPGDVWTSYKAAREAIRMAAGRVDTYYPLDIALWLPGQILRESADLTNVQRSEMEADIRATLELVDPATLDAAQFEKFQRQRYALGSVLEDTPLSDEAFDELERAGSTAGYYLRARALAPKKPEAVEPVSEEDINKAKLTSEYLNGLYSKIVADTRCLHLLFSMEWIAATGRWPFLGLRQPVPLDHTDRVRIRRVLIDLISASSQQVQPRYRYLEAVLNWLVDDENLARETWRSLARETEYVDQSRVLSRHIIADPNGSPMMYEGVIRRRLSEDRWSVFIPSLKRSADLLASSFPEYDLAVGRTIRSFSVGFNYLGALVDRPPRAKR